MDHSTQISRIFKGSEHPVERPGKFSAGRTATSLIGEPAVAFLPDGTAGCVMIHRQLRPGEQPVYQL